jgi:hypothetical protein
MGEPGWRNGQSPAAEYIGGVEGTRGSETSQYPVEEKTNSDSVSSGERKRMEPKPVACDTRRGLRRGGCGTLHLGPPSWDTVRNPWRSGTACEWPAGEGESPVHVTPVGLWWVFPSSAGLVESRVNLPGPPGKAEYFLVTDSARVP